MGKANTGRRTIQAYLWLRVSRITISKTKHQTSV